MGLRIFALRVASWHSECFEGMANPRPEFGVFARLGSVTARVVLCLASLTVAKVTVILGQGVGPLVLGSAFKVTPDGSTTAQRNANTGGYTELFTITNNGSTSQTVTLTCWTTGPITCTGPDANSITVPALSSRNMPVGYDVGAAGTGHLIFKAANGQVSDTGAYIVPVVQPAIPVAVTPDGPAIVALASATITQRFTVQDIGTASSTYNLTATCNGSLTSCTTPASVTLAAGALTTVNVTYHTSTAGTTGRVTLKAVQSTLSSVSDTGWVSVTAGGAIDSLRADIASVNPGSTFERGLCLAIFVGAAAAAECGDLRIVHALATTRTLNKARTPTLLYNSQFAHPYPLVAANLTLPAGDANPDSVVVRLLFGVTQKDRRSWAGSAWAPGTTRRVIVGYDGLTETTGLYSYTLEITTWYGATSRVNTASGQLAVVNRSP